MISGCFASLKDLGSRRKSGGGGGGEESMAGTNHPANQFFSVLWATFKLVRLLWFIRMPAYKVNVVIVTFASPKCCCCGCLHCLHALVLFFGVPQIMEKYADDAVVIDKQCRCFKHMLRSAGPHFESCAQAFSQQIAHSFQRHPSG